MPPTRGPAAPGTRVEEPGDRAIGPAQRGCTRRRRAAAAAFFAPTSRRPDSPSWWAAPPRRPLAATPFISFPAEYSAHCQSTGGATWLQVDRTGGTSDHRSGVPGSLDSAWGLHVVDLNIALGNPVDLVRSESAAFR